MECVSLAVVMTDSLIAPGQAELEKMAARFAPTPLDVDLAHLDPRDVEALRELIHAGHVLDRLFLEQLWSGNLEVEESLRRDAGGSIVLEDDEFKRLRGLLWLQIGLFVLLPFCAALMANGLSVW